MFNNKSDYALNKKNQNSIVYCDSTGHIIWSRVLWKSTTPKSTIRFFPCWDT